MLDSHNPQQNKLAGLDDPVSQTENQLTNLLSSIIKENKKGFAEIGYTLEADIERSFEKNSYESEVYIILRDEEGVVELYPIQVALSLQGEESVIFVDLEQLPGLEEEIQTEIDTWKQKYLI